MRIIYISKYFISFSVKVSCAKLFMKMKEELRYSVLCYIHTPAYSFITTEKCFLKFYCNAT